MNDTVEPTPHNGRIRDTDLDHGKLTSALTKGEFVSNMLTMMTAMRQTQTAIFQIISGRTAEAHETTKTSMATLDELSNALLALIGRVKGDDDAAG